MQRLSLAISVAILVGLPAAGCDEGLGGGLDRDGGADIASVDLAQSVVDGGSGDGKGKGDGGLPDGDATGKDLGTVCAVDDAPCDDGDGCTIDDTCAGGVCVGLPKPCDTPPASVCLAANALRTYDAIGTCTLGACIYAKHTVDCPEGGCNGGHCAGGDLCSGVTCDAPPGACYQTTGTCSDGSCSYDYANGADCDDGNACTLDDSCAQGVCKGTPKACKSPPLPVCENGDVLKVYDSVGTCGVGTGACSYGYGFVTCAKGCSGGACAPSGWTAQTSNVTKYLTAVWGASANDVWAMGTGTILHWNGLEWQSKSVPTEALNTELVAIHGSSATNVFAVGPQIVLRYSGDKWKYVTTTPLGQMYGKNVCVFAYGNDDAFVWGRAAIAGLPARLYRVTGGVATLIKEATDIWTGTDDGHCQIQVFSPTNILVTTGKGAYAWNGTSFVRYGTTAHNANHLFATDASTLAINTGSDLRVWNGTSFDAYDSGGVTLRGMHGTTMNRLFLVGYHWVGDANRADILRFDGDGLVKEPIPTGTAALEAIWAAPTGEVFAVGQSGTILRGP